MLLRNRFVKISAKPLKKKPKVEILCSLIRTLSSMKQSPLSDSMQVQFESLKRVGV